MNAIEISPDKPSREALFGLGEIAFLAARSPQHRTYPMAGVAHWWETPLALKQHWIFRINDIPRLALSWAALSMEAEQRYVVDRKGLRREDWRSGDRIWVIDWIAPFAIKGLNARVRRWIATEGFSAAKSVRFMRLAPDGSTRAIIEIRRNGENDFSRRIMGVQDLAGE